MRMLILVLCVILAIPSCSTIEIESNDIINKYNKLTNYADGETTSFLFFTDPHLNEDDNDNTFESYLKTIEHNYNLVPLEFVLCGGDWLNNGDTNKRAYEKLRFIDDYTYQLFGDDIYHVLGNHDTNYQGRIDDSSELHTGLLSNEEIVDCLFYRQGSSYYSFFSNNARFFVLDTGIDSNYKMDDFRWTQMYWFAQELQTNIVENIVIALHIYTNDKDGTKSPEIFAQHIMEVAEAHNNREKITLNGEDYDFSNATGTVACVLCGHCHKDFVHNGYSIPIIGTTHLQDGYVPTFDLCVFDWDNNIVNLLRIGIGQDRIVLLANRN